MPRLTAVSQRLLTATAAGAPKVFASDFTQQQSRSLTGSGIAVSTDTTELFIVNSGTLTNLFVNSGTLTASGDANETTSVSGTGYLSETWHSFTPDGLHYVWASSNTQVSCVALASAYDIDGVDLSSPDTLNVSAQVTLCTKPRLHPDGTHLFVADTFSGAIYEYSLGTDYDISTATYTNNKYEITDLLDWAFINEGRSIVFCEKETGGFEQVGLSNPYRLSGSVTTGEGGLFDPNVAISTSTGDGTRQIQSIDVRNNQLYIEAGGTVYLYS